MAVVAISITAVQAQDNIHPKTIFSIGAESGFPMGSDGIGGDYYVAIGGSLQVEYTVSRDFGLTLNAGYLLYLGKLFEADNEGMIPVLAGFRYHFTPKIYGSGQAGISFSTVSNGGSAFTYAPGIGFPLSQHADLLVRYEAASKNGRTIANFGVRFAYDF